MEIAAINSDNNYFNYHNFEDVPTENETIYNKKKNAFGKQIKSVHTQCDRLANHVRSNLANNKFPLILSGDHSSGLGSISGVKSAYPDKTLGVIWIDAHADLHSPYTSPSGNIHGMPLAAAIHDDNLDCQINKPGEDTVEYWNRMKNIGIDGQKVRPENLVFFGVRDTEAPEDHQIDKLSIKNYMVNEVRYRGLDTCVSEALNKLSHCDILYISFDVDSMDCDMVSYGTGTPVPKGFDPQEIKDIINMLLESKKVACLEFVEVNPLLDFGGNKMAETAFDILDDVTNTVVKVNA
jgi:arginase